MTISATKLPKLRPLRDREFNLLAALIREKAGIELSQAKKALVQGRLTKRLRALGLGNFYDYYALLLGDDGTEQRQMLNCITTNETSFFREQAHFELLETIVIPKWRRDAETRKRRRKIRVWSAGCSTGQEPYSIAMCLQSALPKSDGWTIEIFASDISTKVLKHAAAGVYPIEEARGIPPRHLQQFMLRGRGEQAGNIRVGKALRSLIQFGRLNLNATNYGFTEPFDLILCRNVLIYFGREEKLRVVHRFLDLLVDDGLLMLGHAESLQGETDRVRSVRPTVYELNEATLRADRNKPAEVDA